VSTSAFGLCFGDERMRLDPNSDSLLQKQVEQEDRRARESNECGGVDGDFEAEAGFFFRFHF
jgi:hypothetical protein